MASSSSNVVGVHYRVGKKIGEGSFGVIFEGTNLLNNQQVAIKFVRISIDATSCYRVIGENEADNFSPTRSQEKATPLSFAMNTELTRF